jgi:1-deoxy-D-xylulose-5-phosphate synthase
MSLPHVNFPADLKSLTREQLRAVSDEVRAALIDSCSRTGGHIGAGLGVVELTVALHYVFDTPRDQLVWDVGHQAYPHKMLTGRRDRFETLRQEGGMSGFLKRDESEYDVFGAGHAATAISAALGVATARDLQHEDFRVLAVLGDGALTSGLAYEGLNNAGASDRDIIVVLNDNAMSIAPNVGAISRYLGQVQRNPIYNRIRSKIGNVVDELPGPLSLVGQLVRRWEESMKSFLTPGVLFEELGFRYFGPIDGHDINVLVDTFTAVKGMRTPRLVHVITKKGKGFPAGENREKWHALPAGHDPSTGKQRKAAPPANPAYTAVFGKGLAELGEQNEKIVAITAAMPTGTGTAIFAAAHPKRFFDVGIAEGHAVTFAAGLATRGIRPVVAIYSTFLQRAYDSIIHDVSLQHLPVIFAMDRAGLVGEDGPTHMGLYDIAYMLAVPGMVVTAPKDGTEMLALLRTGLAHDDGPFCLRYPRDVSPDAPGAATEIAPVPFGTWEVLHQGHDIAILAVGTTVLPALAAAAALAPEGIDPTVVNCRFLKPFDEITLTAVVGQHQHVLVIEEGTVVNGFGAYIGTAIAQIDPAVRVAVHGVSDRYVEQASRKVQVANAGLDASGIARRVRALLETEAVAG